MPRILVTPALLHSTRGPFRDILEGAGFEVVFPSVSEAEYHTPAGLLAQLRGIDGVIAGAEPYENPCPKSRCSAPAHPAITSASDAGHWFASCADACNRANGEVRIPAPAARPSRLRRLMA